MTAESDGDSIGKGWTVQAKLNNRYLVRGIVVHSPKPSFIVGLCDDGQETDTHQYPHSNGNRCTRRRAPRLGGGRETQANRDAYRRIAPSRRTSELVGADATTWLLVQGKSRAAGQAGTPLRSSRDRLTRKPFPSLGPSPPPQSHNIAIEINFPTKRLYWFGPEPIRWRASGIRDLHRWHRFSPERGAIRQSLAPILASDYMNSARREIRHLEDRTARWEQTAGTSLRSREWRALESCQSRTPLVMMNRRLEETAKTVW